MRLGISSSLQYNNAQEWAARQSELGCRAVVFPLSNEIDPDMPMIIEHLADDDAYRKSFKYVSERLVGYLYTRRGEAVKSGIQNPEKP